MKAYAPEINEEVEIRPNGTAHLTPAQMEKLIGRRFDEKLTVPPEGFRWEIVVDVYTGALREMMVRERISTVDGGKSMQGWHQREITKKGTPDGRATATQIGVRKSTPREGDKLTFRHFRNTHALIDPKREILGAKARAKLDAILEEADQARLELLQIYEEKP